MSDERIQFLEGLLTHPGYLLFREHFRSQWGAEGYGRRIKAAIATARVEHANLDAAVSAVDYANDEINKLVSWPVEELRRLTQQRETQDRAVSVSRRGPGL